MEPVGAGEGGARHHVRDPRRLPPPAARRLRLLTLSVALDKAQLGCLGVQRRPPEEHERKGADTAYAMAAAEGNAFAKGREGLAGQAVDERNLAVDAPPLRSGEGSGDGCEVVAAINVPLLGAVDSLQAALEHDAGGTVEPRDAVEEGVAGHLQPALQGELAVEAPIGEPV